MYFLAGKSGGLPDQMGAAQEVPSEYQVYLQPGQRDRQGRLLSRQASLPRGGVRRAQQEHQQKPEGRRSRAQGGALGTRSGRWVEDLFLGFYWGRFRVRRIAQFSQT